MRKAEKNTKNAQGAGWMGSSFGIVPTAVGAGSSEFFKSRPAKIIEIMATARRTKIDSIMVNAIISIFFTFP
jgi:hypothetical protein